MGVTRELAVCALRQFLHSYWSIATAGTVVPHHAISRDMRDALSIPLKVVYPRASEGLTISVYSLRGVVWKEIIEQL